MYIWASTYDFGTIAYAQKPPLNVYADVFSLTTCLNLGLSLNLCPYFVCASSEGSGNTARMLRLVRASAARICDKYECVWMCFFFQSWCVATVNGDKMLSPWQCNLSAYATIDGSDHGLTCSHAISMKKIGINFGLYNPLLRRLFLDHDIIFYF